MAQVLEAQISVLLLTQQLPVSAMALHPRRWSLSRRWTLKWLQPGLRLLSKDDPVRLWDTLGNMTEAPDNPKSSGCLCLAALLPIYSWEVVFMCKTHLS